MNSSANAAILYSIPSLMYGVFLLAVFVFGLINISTYPKPAKWLLLAVGFLLISEVGGLVASSVVVRNFDSEQFLFMSAVLRICTSVVNLVGMSMLVCAVFAGRDQNLNSASHSAQVSSPLGPIEDDNPYTTPRTN